MSRIKRIICMFLCVVVLTTSISASYYQSVYSAEWIAGAVAGIGGAPLLTALLVGGVVVAGGIAVHEFLETDSEDYSSFYNGVKTGFNEFVSEQEKKIALEQNSSLSDQEASDIGIANARDIVNNFFSNTIDNVKNTTKTVKASAYEYWDLYSRIIGNVADVGIPDTPDIEDITSNTKYNCNVTNFSSYSLPKTSAENTGDTNAVKIDDIWYNWRGQTGYMMSNDGTISTTLVQAPRNTNNNVIRLPFNILCTNNDFVYNRLWYVDYNKTTKQFIQAKQYSEYTIFPSSNVSNTAQILSMLIAVCQFPVFVINNWQDNSPVTDLLNSYDNCKRYLGIGSSEEIPTYKRTIDTTLKNTHIGNSIKTGRRQLVNSGDYVGSIFVEDSLPIKKSGLKVNEGVATGTVGWDIPAPDIWDDYLAGNLPFPDVVGGTGTIVVPKGNVTDYPTDSTVDFPSDTTVTDSYPKIDDDTGEETPETTPDEVIQDQAGSFYPTALDLTNIFPFCIPFDIIYLVQQYANVEEEAPVIDFEIPYPNALKPSLGESYHVEVDFADYVSVRNVLRIFILLLFVVGLMKITRDLIRG